MNQSFGKHLGVKLLKHIFVVNVFKNCNRSCELIFNFLKICLKLKDNINFLKKASLTLSVFAFPDFFKSESQYRANNSGDLQGSLELVR